MEVELALLPSTVFFIFIAFMILKKSKTKKNICESKLPPGPKKLPLIGNLNLLFGKLPHRCLRDLAIIYGPIMHLQLGEVSAIVISSSEITKEIFQNHSSNFSDRPFINAVKSITYQFSDLVFAKYGDHWREMRKICTMELLSHKRVQSFESVRQEVISSLVQTISSRSGLPICMSEVLDSTSQKFVSRAALGREFKHQEAFKEHVKEILLHAAGFSAVDLFPSFKIFHLINSLSPKLKRLHRRVDEILESVIRERRAYYKKGNERSSEVKDILSVLLSLQDDGDLKVPLTDTIIKALILDLFVAGGEGTSITVEWALTEMLREPSIMEKAQTEVRQIFSTGKVEEASLHQLKYLKCVVKETLRLHPPAPLLVPLQSRDKCVISGYDIPEKTRLIINAWAIGQDENQWINPERFYPERFFEKEVKGVNYEFIPFGVGKRKCPGEVFGLINLELMLSNLLYHFDWKLADERNPQDLEMNEIFFTACRRKDGLKLIPIHHHVPIE